MQRLFGSINDDQVCLSEKDLHHILNVKRFRNGECFELVTSSKTYLCKITCLSPFKTEIIKEISANRELKVNIHLGFVLLKGDHNSLIVEKCTELGCSSFYPLISERCVIKADIKDDSKRIDRLNRIAKEASEQSRRDTIPNVEKTMELSTFLDIPSPNKVIAYEELAGSSETLFHFLKNNSNISDIHILIGPEGGFSKSEVDLAVSKGFVPVSLGKTILRGETACISSVSLVSAILGESNE